MSFRKIKIWNLLGNTISADFFGLSHCDNIYSFVCSYDEIQKKMLALNFVTSRLVNSGKKFAPKLEIMLLRRIANKPSSCFILNWLKNDKFIHDIIHGRFEEIGKFKCHEDHGILNKNYISKHVFWDWCILTAHVCEINISPYPR